MMATIARSIPRPMTTTPIARPRTPRIETLRTSAMRLPGVRKLCSVAANSAKTEGKHEDDAFLRDSDSVKIE
jgi:hypothetical protein